MSLLLRKIARAMSSSPRRSPRAHRKSPSKSPRKSPRRSLRKSPRKSKSPGRGRFRLRKAPLKNLYWVVETGVTGKHFSKSPMPKERAYAQMRALYASASFKRV